MAEILPVLDKDPMDAIAGAAAIACIWLALQMLYVPTGGSEIPLFDFAPKLFNNMLYTSYLVSWIAYTLTAVIQIIAYAITLPDPTFMLSWTVSVGFWGSIFVCAVPWILVAVYIGADPTWSTTPSNQLLTLWNLIGGILVWATYFTVHLIFMDRFAAFSHARILMIKKCTEKWGDMQHPYFVQCWEEALLKATAGITSESSGVN